MSVSISHAKKPRRGPGRPSLHEGQRIQEQILTTAFEHFIRHGYQNTNVDAIADECRIARSAIYNRYRNKLALFSAVCQMVADRFYALELPADYESLDFAAALKAKARALLRCCAEPEGLLIYQLLSTETSSSEEMQTSLRALHDFYVGECLAFLHARIAKGEIRLGDVGIAARMLVAQIFSVINTCQVMKLDIPGRQELFAMSDLSMDIFCGGMEAFAKHAPALQEQAA